MSKDTSFDKNIKNLFILLGLLILSPIVLNVSFKALKVFTEQPKIIIAYTLLVIGILLILYTVYFGFKTFKNILDSLFNQ
ncbi:MULTISPECIES: DUF6095 family protein [Tenacibaculum]|uniref:DUF6095 family protein n=1 Tax=Tenacibaculum TaxID=104267 RepID=UPI00089CB2CD|nr:MULTISPECIES: DUF6095 family protein [unclassified Tenacibaculum]RBW55886.1 hypothetical protein DS884_16185 [Tenacibaculum sp. E3R01]SEE65500.1 hypothetical protein SAMN04487765_3622 [Tenacibaculum sp. MAR_2010_89]